MGKPAENDDEDDGDGDVDGDKARAAPLTHHRIVELLAPFAARGFAVDLAASQRGQRRVVFKARQSSIDGLGVVREVLVLEDRQREPFKLLRRIEADHGSALNAELIAEGGDCEALLAQFDAIAPAAQFEVGVGFIAAFSYVFRSARANEAARPVLTAASAIAAGARLNMQLSRIGSVAADVQLAAHPSQATPAWPDDLLAVLGRDWSRLSLRGAIWHAQLRLPRREPARSAQARQRVVDAAAHVAATLAASPLRFHDRHRAARWVFALRRSVPLLVCLGLIGAALSVPLLGLERDSVWRMLIFNSPPLMLVVFFALREMPRFEIPPLPRALAPGAWRVEPPVQRRPQS